MIFTAFTMFCNNHHYLLLECFYHLKHKIHAHLAVTSQSLETTNLHFLSMDFPNSKYFIYMKLYNMWHFVTGFFPQHDILQVHPQCSLYQYFIPSYGWITLHHISLYVFLASHLLLAFWAISIFFFAIVNNTAVNIHMFKSVFNFGGVYT